MRNIELKARLRDIAAARRTCKAIGAERRGTIKQIDYYFRVSPGRLKLRENVPGDMELIYYHRDDTEGSKASDYEIVVGSPELLDILVEALGLRTVVRKKRELWLWQNVRIHLDSVARLGTFVEFEVVLGGNSDEADGHAKIARLRDDFVIGDSDLIACGYLELLHDLRP